MSILDPLITRQSQTATDSSELATVVQEIDFIKLASNNDAKKSFKSAREEATTAFSNTSLSLEDRILATKLRITARILESLDEPDVAGRTCRLYIEELCEIPAALKKCSLSLLKVGSDRILTKRSERRLLNLFLLSIYCFIILSKNTRKNNLTYLVGR